MNNEAETKPTAKETNEVVLAHKRRTALILYLAILFGAALLFVVISMVTQNQKLMATSSSALDRAEALQSENRELQEQNQALTERIETLESEQADALAQAEQAANAYSELEKAHDELSASYAALEQEIETLKQTSEEVKTAYELLLTALSASEDGKKSEFQSAMEALAPMKELLGEEGLALYELLAEKLPQE